MTTAETEDIVTAAQNALARYADTLKNGGLTDIALAKHAVFDLIEAYGDARVAQERERCAQVVDRIPGSYEVARAAQIIRNLE